MRHVDHHVAFEHVRIGKHLFEIVDGTARHLGRFQRYQPVGFAALLQQRSQQRHQRVAVTHAVGVARVQRIEGERWLARHGTELGELAVVADGQDEVPVRDLEHLVRHDVLVRVAHARRRYAGCEIVGPQVGEHGHLGVEQGHVDHLALSGGVTVPQCGQDGHCGVHAGEQIRDGHADFLRPAARQVVALTGHAHQAADALNGVVVAGALAVRAGLPEAGDRAVHQPRVERAQRRGVQAVARHVADLEVLDEHVAVQGQLADHVLPLGPCDVDRDRAFVAVGAQVVRGLGAVFAVAVLQKRRAPAARVIAAVRAFDLDDVGTQVGQRLGAPRAGQHARQVQHPNAGKALCRWSADPGLHARIVVRSG